MRIFQKKKVKKIWDIGKQNLQNHDKICEGKQNGSFL